MYNIGQTFFLNEYKQNFCIKKANYDLDLYICENVNPPKGEHGVPIMFTIYLSGEYISNHIFEK